MAEVDQGVQVFVGADVHAAARTAVAAVRAAERNELLATEANAAVAAVAGEHFDFCFVYQFHCFDACDGRGICAVALNHSHAEARVPSMPGSGVGRDDADGATLLGALDRELHLAVHEGEQGVVTAQAHAGTRVELGAALTHDDVAGFDGLAAEDLDAQVLRVGVATVARGAYALFMCHDCFS
ncbi:hypothetical protein G6F65_012074 [Rhizopus arrhizus]|nr:hypothetical protein G6F65_012074 [Rhizopus arrhizus]